jgi:tRNA C32,U32 (ribose-2'-O)-methylase TrmJ
VVRNPRNLLQRAQLTEQEVRTPRGVAASLTTRRKGG